MNDMPRITYHYTSDDGLSSTTPKKLSHYISPSQPLSTGEVDLLAQHSLTGLWSIKLKECPVGYVVRFWYSLASSLV